MTCRAFRYTTLFVALIVFGLAHNANAQFTYFPNDTTIKSAVRGNILIGYVSRSAFQSKIHPTSPTIRLVNGGSITGQLYVHNSSTANINGGIIINGIQSYEHSAVNIGGGNVGFIITAWENSTVTIKDGNLRSVYASHNSTVNINGGKMTRHYRATAGWEPNECRSKSYKGICWSSLSR